MSCLIRNNTQACGLADDSLDWLVAGVNQSTQFQHCGAPSTVILVVDPFEGLIGPQVRATPFKSTPPSILISDEKIRMTKALGKFQDTGQNHA